MSTKYISHYSIFIALAVITGYLINFPIFPQVPFLVYDPGHVFLLIAAFKFGPRAGMLMTLVYALIFAIITGHGGPYGALMNFISTSAFVLISSWIYLKYHNRKGAIIGLVLGFLFMTIIMIPANLIITPLFLGVGKEDIIEILSFIILFNLIKGIISSILTLLVYKKISLFLKQQGI